MHTHTRYDLRAELGARLSGRGSPWAGGSGAAVNLSSGGRGVCWWAETKRSKAPNRNIKHPHKLFGFSTLCHPEPQISRSLSVPPCAGQGGLHGPRFFRSSRLLSHIFCPWFVVYPFHAIFRCLFFLLSSRYINSRFLTSTATLAILSSQHTHTHTQSGVACVLLRTSPFLVHCAAARFAEATKSTQKKVKTTHPDKPEKYATFFGRGFGCMIFCCCVVLLRVGVARGCLMACVRACPLHCTLRRQNAMRDFPPNANYSDGFPFFPRVACRRDTQKKQSFPCRVDAVGGCWVVQIS